MNTDMAITAPQMEKTTLLDAYLSGPGILRAAVAGISREQLVSRPVAKRWSVLEVVCHLADTDGNIAHRIKRVLSEERPVFDRVNPELMLAALAYHDRDVEEELGVFDLTRRQIGRILTRLPPQPQGTSQSRCSAFQWMLPGTPWRQNAM